MKQLGFYLSILFFLFNNSLMASPNHGEKLIHAGQKGGIFVHGAPLFEKADENSTQIADLPIGTLIEILFIESEYKRFRKNKGRWTKVNAIHRVPSESSEFEDKNWTGFVHSSFIVTHRMLERSSSWNGITNLISCSSDVCVRYVFNSDGTYEGYLHDWNNEEHHKVPKGLTYRYQQLIFLGSEEAGKKSFWEIIVIDRLGSYCFDYHITDNGLCWKP